MPEDHSLSGYSYLIELKSKNIISCIRDSRAIFPHRVKKKGLTALWIKKLSIIMEL